MVLTTLCYVQKETQTLMLHRMGKDDDIHMGKWNGLGGKFEAGETPEACVIREVKEESGLDIKKPKMRGMITFPEFKNRQDWYVFIFVATEFSGELTSCAEGWLEWIETETLAKLVLWEGDYVFLEWLKRERFFSAIFRYKDKCLLDYDVEFY